MPVGNVERILIELRPRLQSANFFVCFSRGFAEIKSTKIDLGSDRIIISTENDDESYEIKLGDYFKLHTQTLSSLMIKKNYICFRINTNENKFHSEVLEINDYRACNEFKIECGLQTGVSYTLVCSNCGSHLRDEPVTFRRILELPSDHMDSNEWYCHRHPHTANGVSSNEECSSKPPHPNKFAPAETDLFYAPFYALLAKTHLDRVHLKAERFLYCKRCLQFLGMMKRSGCAKLWYENLRFLQRDDDESNKIQTNSLCLFRVDQSLSNFLYLVRKTVNEFNFMSHLGLPSIFKIIFEMRRPGLDGEVFHLLLQIMDAKLTVFKIRKTLDVDSSASNEQTDEDEDEENADDKPDDDDDEVFVSAKKNNCNNVYLDRYQTMKVMYRYEKYDQQPIVNFWLQDPNVVVVEISDQMLRAAICYLDTNSDYVPECYRHNLGFQLSYLDIT
ncbi:uncharacterized protein LOC129765045 [Toxorhynchites rutilus septentrionalis]|uniref:uncharacterized protein LOC129765045 n=1 Tax=Toxorhynchites rutilus septentrionalis TaxID=329112 RepID=UPI00247975D3|nr:uncharacterized protein LOC129765045 [Toxorhynchites rutilus septentrionalis]